MVQLVIIFTNDIFGEIRTCLVNNQIMFVGKDVATALGYAKPQNALAAHVDSEDKSTAPIRGAAYETRVTLINESGLYALILSSKLPQAKIFKRWVTNVVLPQIRKTGGYIPTTDAQGRQLTSEEIIDHADAIVGRTLRMLNEEAEDTLTARASCPMDDDSHGNGHRGVRHRPAGLPEYAERVGTGRSLN